MPTSPSPTRVPAARAPLPTATAEPFSRPAAVSTPATAITAATSPVPTTVYAASLLGEWRFRAETGERDIEGTLRFEREGTELTGLYVSPNGAATLLSNLQVSDNRISWDLVTPRTTWHLKGTFSDTWMNGTFQTTTRTVQWTATKQSGAAGPSPTAPPRP